MFFLLLFAIYLLPEILSLNYFELISQNNDVASTTDPIWLKGSFHVHDLAMCLVQCNLNPDCESVVFSPNYEARNQTCFLYGKLFHSSETQLTTDTNLYSIACPKFKTLNRIDCMRTDQSLIHVFDNYKQQIRVTNFTGTAFQLLTGFENVHNNGIFNYYAYDFVLNKVIVYDETWTYQFDSYVFNPAYFKVIEDDFFFFKDNGISRTNKSFSEKNNLLNTGFGYRGAYYEVTTGLIYTGSYVYSQIKIYDTSLTSVDTIMTGPHKPSAFAAYDNKIYVGTASGSILIIQNNKWNSTFSTPCGGVIQNLHIDVYGYMAVVCHAQDVVYLYHTNGTNMNKSINTADQPKEFKFDSKGRLIISSYFEFNIYY